jgi:2-polyprenyl-6-methoxyphenol hydroxylase-like FAD-dependent oxidoreductase
MSSDGSFVCANPVILMGMSIPPLLWRDRYDTAGRSDRGCEYRWACACILARSVRVGDHGGGAGTGVPYRGPNIDVRGAARLVLRRAGIEDAVRAATTGEVGTRFVGRDGRVVAEFPARRSDTAGATAEVEVLRGDLARILVDATAAGCTEYRYGDEIAALDDTGSDVLITYASGSQERFDLVVAADGLRSSTRPLAVGGPVTIRPLGMEMTYLTIPRRDSDTDWWNWYTAPGGRGVTLRPDRQGTTRAFLSSIIYDHRTAAGGHAYRRAARRRPVHPTRRPHRSARLRAPRAPDGLRLGRRGARWSGRVPGVRHPRVVGQLDAVDRALDQLGEPLGV